MSTLATLDETIVVPGPEAPELEYRALHTGAIVGFVLGVASVFTLVTAASSLESCLRVIPIPLVGMFVSWRAWSQISQQSELYVGNKLAATGLALSTFFLVAGVGYGAYVYKTELPPGYARISFGALKPDEVDQRGGKIIPDEIMELDGQKVFVKGFIRPDSVRVRTNAKDFLLVRDSNECCFGDLSKINYFDQMQVDVVRSKGVDFHRGLFRMGGTLHMHPENIARGPGWPVFSLQADYVK